MHRAYLTRNTDRVRVTGTPSPGSVAPASFINTVSLVPRPEKRAWYTLSAHAPKCTENPGTSYISVKQSVNHRT